MTSQEKLIERIKKLLAFSNDVSSPKEAAIALRRARNLMDKHQLSHEDLLTAEYSEFKEGGTAVNVKNKKIWHSLIAGACLVLNDCNGFNIVKNGKRIYCFQGYSADVKTCEFMFSYLIQAGEQFFKIDKKRYAIDGVRGKNSYLLGYASEICTRVDDIIKQREKIKTSTGTGLIVAKKAMVEKKFGVMKFREVDTYQLAKDSYSRELGVEAGKKAHLGEFLDSPNDMKAQHNLTVKS